jgi:hypothetical protein
MWEHVLHQQQQRHYHQQQQQQRYRPFLPSTLAYAALLLAMEDLQLPLPDKQACCLALLQVADMSTHTPQLSTSYSWLVFAKGMHQQLVAQQQQQLPPPSQQQQPPPCAAFVNGATATTKPSSSVPMVSPSASDISIATATTTTNTSMGSFSSSDSHKGHRTQQSSSSSSSSLIMTVEQTVVPVQMTTSSDEGDSESTLYAAVDCDDPLTEVIFYSHTYMGDGFEVMTVRDSQETEEEEDEDDEDLLPDTETLVLTESLDEDGFEVSYVTDTLLPTTKGFQEECHLANMLASPRDVTY